MAPLSASDNQPCALGVGCSDFGICYADAHGQPEQCPHYNLREELAGLEALALADEEADVERWKSLERHQREGEV